MNDDMIERVRQYFLKSGVPEKRMRVFETGCEKYKVGAPSFHPHRTVALSPPSPRPPPPPHRTVKYRRWTFSDG